MSMGIACILYDCIASGFFQMSHFYFINKSGNWLFGGNEDGVRRCSISRTYSSSAA